MLERLALVASLFAVSTANAEVVETTSTGFLVKLQASIAAASEKTYRGFAEINRWWSPDHTYSGDANNLALDMRPGGCFCEKLANGGGVQHMTIVYLAPGQTVRLAGGLGPLQGSGLAGSMTWKFTPDSLATNIELTYSVGGYVQGGFEKLAPAVNFVLAEQLGRFKAYVETGKPAAPK